MFRTISQIFLNRFILFLIAILIISHIIAMFYFIRQNRNNSINLHRSEVIQKIVNAIYLVEATPLTDRQKAVAAMADPDLKVTLTPKAAWPLKFTDLSYWKINHALRHSLGTFKLSIQLDNQQWLNLKASIYTHYLTNQLILLAIEILVFSCLYLAIWSVYRFTEPLKRIKQAAMQLGVDLHSEQLDIYGPKVVRDAAHALNQMQLRIQELIRDRTQMLAAISHDLRTPITRLKLLSQFVEEEHLQNTMLNDLDEMSSMINETLQFTREDAHTENMLLFDLSSLISTICDNMNDLGHAVKFSTPTSRIAYTGRKLAIKRALTNLIQNAVRYGKEVDISISKKSKNIIINVIDNGPGIPEEKIEKVFSPFYRVEPSRSKDTGGAGLGLAITRDIIQSHGGSILLKNKKPHGLNVQIILPGL